MHYQLFLRLLPGRGCSWPLVAIADNLPKCFLRNNARGWKRCALPSLSAVRADLPCPFSSHMFWESSANRSPEQAAKLQPALGKSWGRRTSQAPHFQSAHSSAAFWQQRHSGLSILPVWLHLLPLTQLQVKATQSQSLAPPLARQSCRTGHLPGLWRLDAQRPAGHTNWCTF